MRQRSKYINFRDNTQIDKQAAQTRAHRTLHFQRAIEVVAGYFLRCKKNFSKLQRLGIQAFYSTRISHRVHCPRLSLIF